MLKKACRGFSFAVVMCSIARSRLSESRVLATWARGGGLFLCLCFGETRPQGHREADTPVLRLRFSWLSAHLSQVLERREAL